MRKRYSSLADYIQDAYYDEFFGSIRKYIRESGHSGYSSGSFLISLSEVELDDIRIRSVKAFASDSEFVNFVAAVEANIVLKGLGRRDYDADSKTEWFSVYFTGQLLDGLNMVTIIRVEDYRSERFDKETTLSKYMVPYLYAEDLEKEAEAFLGRYCRKALEAPMAVDIEELLFNLSLDMYHAPLSDNLFGMTYFTEADVEIIDDETDKVINQHVDPGTILINPNIFFMRNVGSENNTIIHECLHWDRHRRFFELQKLLNPDLHAIACSTTEKKGIKDSGLDGALQWMEWQCNALAPRVQMPQHTTRAKLNEILRELKANMPGVPESNRMEKAICILADFFHVSKFAAKLRAIELGFTTAIGVLNYVDDHYLPSFSFNALVVNKDETFVIDDKNATFESCVDPVAREKLERGSYVYVDCVFCVDDEEYVTLDANGNMTLTEYARQHMDECCVKFRATHKHSETSGDTFYTRCALCRNIASDVYNEMNYVDDEQNSFVSQRAEKAKRRKTEAQYIVDVLRRLPPLFTTTLQYHFDHFEKKGWKAGQLTEMQLGRWTNYSERQIRKFLTEESTTKEITATCALCVGLQLIPDFSDNLVDKSGYRWRLTEEDQHFKRILRYQYRNSLEFINEQLKELGCRTWGGRSSGTEKSQ